MKKIQRIFIWGSVASGKTTLAKRLSSLLGISKYTLGDFVYKSYPEKRFSENERNNQIESLAKKEKWIIEGVYWKKWTLPIFSEADIIIVLDIKKTTLYFRVIKRALEEMLRGDFTNFKTLIRKMHLTHKSDELFYKNYKKLIDFNKKKFFILRNQNEIDNFIKSLS